MRDTDNVTVGSISQNGEPIKRKGLLLIMLRPKNYSRIRESQHK